MNKVDIAYNRLLDLLPGSTRQWTLEALLWDVNWALDLDQMVSMATLRRAVARLPESCVRRAGQRLIVGARAFAKRHEVMAALRSLPTWSDTLPVLIERHKSALCRALVLENDWALIQSLEWAAAGAFTVTYTVYGLSVRCLPAWAVAS